MAEFPRYLSKGKATTQQPSFLAAESTEGQVTEQVARATQTAQNLTFKMGEAYQEAQKTQAEVNQRTQIDDLLARAEADPDYNAFEKYRQENEKIKKESISGFKNKLTQSEAASKANYYSATADRQLQSIFHKKMIDNQQANTLQLLDLEVRNPSSATPDRIKGILDKQKSLGFINEKDAYALEQKYTKQAKQNAFLGDINVDAELAAENLKKNVYDFDIVEMSKAKEMVESAKKKQEEAFKNAQMATVNDFGEKLASRTLTMEEVENAAASGLIDADMALNFNLAMAGPDKWSDFASENEQGQKSKLITGLLQKLSEDDTENRVKIVNSALQNYNDKKLNSDDLRFILRVSNGKSIEPQKPIWGFLKAAISSIPPIKSQALIMEKFKNRWDMQEDPREVMKQAAIDQYKEDKPETAPYKVGDVIKRKSGSYEVSGFNEDGSPVFRKK